MDKKSAYLPVVSSDIAIKPFEKCALPQGSLKKSKDLALKKHNILMVS